MTCLISCWLRYSFFAATPIQKGPIRLRGNAYYKKGQYDRAIADYNTAIRLKPDLALAFNNRGLAYSDKAQYDRAIDDYNTAIRLKPDYTLAFNNRGNAKYYKGQTDRAIDDYSAAIRLKPDDALAYNNLAWLYATADCAEGTCRNGRRAVELAEKAVSMMETPNNIDTLAAAYAEVGRFQDAVKTQEKVIRMLKDKVADEKEVKDYEKRLASYRAGNPWREK